MACDKTPPPGLDIVPNTHVHPNYAKHPVAGDRYSAYNKPYSIMHWMEHAKPTEDFIIVLDADMAFRSDGCGFVRGGIGKSRERALRLFSWDLSQKSHGGESEGTKRRRRAASRRFYSYAQRRFRTVSAEMVVLTEQVSNDPDSWEYRGCV